MKKHSVIWFPLSLLAFLTVCVPPCNGYTTAYDGMSEALGHYRNMLQGQKARPPTKVKLALVGLPRTGTGSLTEALSLLGYTTLHADEYVELSDLFAELTDEENPISMGSFVAKVGERGFDAMYYWDHNFVSWAAANKDLKIILTVRDTPKKWTESFESVGTSWERILLSRPFIWLEKAKQLAPVTRKLFQFMHEDRSTFENTYSKHVHQVRQFLADHSDSENKLLVFNAKQGWEPLCQFLDLDKPCPPSPGMPFPHANERYLLQIENAILLSITWVWPLLPIMFFYMIWMGVRTIASWFKPKLETKKKAS